jgi:hypothetical protein
MIRRAYAFGEVHSSEDGLNCPIFHYVFSFSFATMLSTGISQSSTTDLHAFRKELSFWEKRGIDVRFQVPRYMKKIDHYTYEESCFSSRVHVLRVPLDKVLE